MGDQWMPLHALFASVPGRMRQHGRPASASAYRLEEGVSLITSNQDAGGNRRNSSFQQDLVAQHILLLAAA
jgi:hypothetical protein